MGWFRSAPMEYWSVAIPQNASHKVVAALGKLGSIQFVDVRVLTAALRSILCLILSPSGLTFVGLYCCPFVQLNQDLTAFQRRFVDQVKRCNSLERILEFFQEVIEQHGIPIPVRKNR